MVWTPGAGGPGGLIPELHPVVHTYVFGSQTFTLIAQISVLSKLKRNVTGPGLGAQAVCADHVPNTFSGEVG